MLKNIKVVEVIERPLEGVVERAEFAEKLLRDIASEAWLSDNQTALADLLRKQANELGEFLSKHGHELRYGKQSL